MLLEVWAMIFSHDSLNDLMEISCVSKMFYSVARKNKFFLEKIDHSQKISRIGYG